MKKFIYIFIFCFSSFCYAQDACYNIYREALQEYNKGNYSEAQRKLVIVAQTCGDYSDVWNKLKSCNKKILEKQNLQATEITILKNEKQKLETEKKKSDEKLIQIEALKNKAAMQLDQLRKDTTALNKRYSEIQQELITSQNNMINLGKDLDCVRKELKTATDSIQVLLTKINNNTTKGKGEKKDKKKAEVQASSASHTSDAIEEKTKENKTNKNKKDEQIN